MQLDIAAVSLGIVFFSTCFLLLIFVLLLNNADIGPIS
ncbi:hypothetical protein LMG33818_000439 [Halomonadaceae bacterium LMG 33818]